jgi:hypothetical protein
MHVIAVAHDIALVQATDLSKATAVLQWQAADVGLVGSTFFLGSHLLWLRQLIVCHSRVRFIAYATENDALDPRASAYEAH